MLITLNDRLARDSTDCIFVFRLLLLFRWLDEYAAKNSELSTRFGVSYIY